MTSTTAAREDEKKKKKTLEKRKGTKMQQALLRAHSRAHRAYSCNPLSLFADLFYGSLPAPTFELPDGRLQPDFLMDVFPDGFFFILAFSCACGVTGFSYFYLNDTQAWIASIIPVFVHYVLFFAHGK